MRQRSTDILTTSNRTADRSKYLLEYGYDLNNNISKFVNTTRYGMTTTNYTYDKDNVVKKINLLVDSATRDIDYTYDEIGRLKTKKTTTNTPLVSTYLYNPSANRTGYASTQLSAEEIGNVLYYYTYDSCGNITEIKRRVLSEGVLPKPYRSYTYNSLQEMTSETIRRPNGTSMKNTYTYDSGGNITSVVKTAYNSSGGIANEATISYSYDDSNWKDKMTKYNGQSITYDAIGNPLTYRNGINMTWKNGRQLDTFQKSGNSVSYTYDENGIRATKTSNGVKHEYQYANGKLVLDQYGNKAFHFSYDAEGNLAQIMYYPNASANNPGGYLCYYPVTNSRGDVIELRNHSGDLVCRYEYDAWGSVFSVTNSSGASITDPNHIANLNPIRYRGYYYDTDTGFYYLKSRYYDPNVGRFINADGIFDTKQDIQGTNMYAYCGNNPVTRADPTGKCYIDRYTNAGTFIGSHWTSATPGEDNYCIKCGKSHFPTKKAAPPQTNWIVPSNVQADNNAKINTLASNVQPLARDFLAKANNAGYALVIVWAFREDADEEAFIKYAKSMGWANPEQYGVRGGKHTKGRAFDVEFWDPALEGVWPCDSFEFWKSNHNGMHNPSDPRWRELGAIGESVGLDWGGHFADVPHFYK